MVGNTYGYIFSGCDIYLNGTDVYLKDSKGIIFSGCQFGKNAKIIIDGGGEIQFNGCLFATPPTISITNNSHVQFKDCYTIDGDPIAIQ
jgi:hypothetical protein